jgi:hypothetical protein
MVKTWTVYPVGGWSTIRYYGLLYPLYRFALWDDHSTFIPCWPWHTSNWLYIHYCHHCPNYSISHEVSILMSYHLSDLSLGVAWLVATSKLLSQRRATVPSPSARLSLRWLSRFQMDDNWRYPHWDIPRKSKVWAEFNNGVAAALQVWSVGHLVAELGIWVNLF